MALRRFFLPILISVLLFSQVLARELEEKPAADEMRVAVKHDTSLKAYEGDEPDGFDDEKHYWYGHGHRYRHGYRHHRGPRHEHRHPPYCRFHCGYRCCSAEEYAEFVQDEN